MLCRSAGTHPDLSWSVMNRKSTDPQSHGAGAVSVQGGGSAVAVVPTTRCAVWKRQRGPRCGGRWRRWRGEFHRHHRGRRRRAAGDPQNAVPAVGCPVPTPAAASTGVRISCLLVADVDQGRDCSYGRTGRWSRARRRHHQPGVGSTLLDTAASRPSPIWSVEVAHTQAIQERHRSMASGATSWRGEIMAPHIWSACPRVCLRRPSSPVELPGNVRHRIDSPGNRA